MTQTPLFLNDKRNGNGSQRGAIIGGDQLQAKGDIRFGYDFDRLEIDKRDYTIGIE
jgi:hypothetical protein